MYLIDQHAAHERVMLEKLRQQKSERRVEKQGLLPAETFEIEPRLAAILGSHLGAVVEMGFEIEAFGPKRLHGAQHPGRAERPRLAGGAQRVAGEPDQRLVGKPAQSIGLSQRHPGRTGLKPGRNARVDPSIGEDRPSQ